ncbi:TPA: hypothetical protein DCE37_14080 [Candidatus Latescibacteria bacterium]|nr:hypothetical protein [Candidatus Latescibacterota bacterium]|tara:strand:- start:519 stop:1262 length:744 start_codon:yes stop_codon:yes gene_type:complete
METRPNTLWISTHDTSAGNLGCYGDSYADTPNLDRLAEQGVRYTHAFTAGPICSPSRTSIYTGMHPTTLGTHHHRSAVIRPDGVKLLPRMLMDSGYACTKPDQDINLYVSREEFGSYHDVEGFLASRPKDKPFFAYHKLGSAHASVFKRTGQGDRAISAFTRALESEILWARLRAGAYLTYCSADQLHPMKALIPALQAAIENQGLFGPEHEPFLETNQFGGMVDAQRDTITRRWVLERAVSRIKLA